MDTRRRGQFLEYATVAWNSVEAIVALGTGVAAHSLALVAFGLDSCIEVFSSAVVLWHLGRRSSSRSEEQSTRALRLIALAFIVLGGYLAVQAVRGLVTHAHPDSAPLGTAFMAATVVVMFTLAWGKRRVGNALDSRPLAADATMTRHRRLPRVRRAAGVAPRPDCRAVVGRPPRRGSRRGRGDQRGPR